MFQLAVFIGGGLGAVLRTLLGKLVSQQMGAGGLNGGFPWGTLAVNLLGCFLIGLVAAAVGREGSTLRAFLVPGLLGGFTTFSAFSLETTLLYERGAYIALVLYVTASVAGGLLLVLAGSRLGRIF